MCEMMAALVVIRFLHPVHSYFLTFFPPITMLTRTAEKSTEAVGLFLFVSFSLLSPLPTEMFLAVSSTTASVALFSFLFWRKNVGRANCFKAATLVSFLCKHCGSSGGSGSAMSESISKASVAFVSFSPHLRDTSQMGSVSIVSISSFCSR